MCDQGDGALETVDGDAYAWNSVTLERLECDRGTHLSTTGEVNVVR